MIDLALICIFAVFYYCLYLCARLLWRFFTPSPAPVAADAHFQEEI